MKDPTRYCVLDYETFGERDLTEVGAWEYAQTAEILCVAWKIGTREELANAPAKIWSPKFPSPYGELIRALCDPSVTLVAHNSFFEQVITCFALRKLVNRPELSSLSPSRWICTASLAAALALPRKLETVCRVLNLKNQKDMTGHRLMLKLSQPRKPTKHNPSTRHEDPEELKRLMDYCVRDIEAETELFLKLPPLHPTERKVWVLDQEINWRGFRVDRPLVQSILGMVDEESKSLTLRIQTVSEGRLQTPGQTAEMGKLLSEHGCALPNLQKKTVEDALKMPLTPTARELLEIRQASSKTSTKKYLAFEERSRTDGVIRDHLLYCGAGPGRWSGRGVQPQNFPKGALKDPLAACREIPGGLEWMRLLYGAPLETFSSLLRSMIIAREGKKFFCGDYSAIEVRVLFWIADHKEGLEFYYKNRDIYREMARIVYGLKTLSEVTEAQRHLGKKIILGCGYQMGWKKFIQTCLNEGIIISEELAENSVRLYRQIHHPVPTLWENTQKATVYAIEHPTKRITMNKMVWGMEGDFLFCTLPSGRKNAYYKPSVRYEYPEWDKDKRQKRPVLRHWGLNSMTNQWEEEHTYGGKLVENFTQGTARDFMAAAMMRLNAKDYETVLSVHDELLSENYGGSLEECISIMEEIPEWGKGCPIKVSNTAWTGDRYRK